MRGTRKLCRILAPLLLVSLTGCEAVALTLLGVGVGVTSATAVNYTMNGIAYRTFTAPVPDVERATLASLNQMGFQIKGKEIEGREESPKAKVIRAAGNERVVEVRLERVSPRTTRMRTIVDHGTIFKDRATATEIIIQTEKILESRRTVTEAR